MIVRSLEIFAQLNSVADRSSPKGRKVLKNTVPSFFQHVFVFQQMWELLFLTLLSKGTYSHLSKESSYMFIFFGNFCPDYTIVRSYTFIKALKISNE